MIALILYLVFCLVSAVITAGAYLGTFLMSLIPLIPYQNIEWVDSSWIYNGEEYNVCDGYEAAGCFDFYLDENGPLFVWDETLEKEDIIGKNRAMYRFSAIYKLADEEFGDNLLYRDDGFTAIKEGYSLPDIYSLDMNSFFVFDGGGWPSIPSEWERLYVISEGVIRISDVLDTETEYDITLPSETSGYIGFDVAGYNSLYVDPIPVFRVDGAYYAKILEGGEYKVMRIKDEYHDTVKALFKQAMGPDTTPGDIDYI